MLKLKWLNFVIYYFIDELYWAVIMIVIYIITYHQSKSIIILAFITAILLSSLPIYLLNLLARPHLDRSHFYIAWLLPPTFIFILLMLLPQP